MARTLVSIEVDLASSFAIRFACQLGNFIPLEIQPVYVKGYPEEEPITGIGWVRHTWEREMVREGKQEIQEMILAEMTTCPLLREPTVLFGERDKELMQLITSESYDLYIEGAPYPFTPATVAKRLQGKFYQHLPCPLIWLRSLPPLTQVLILCLEPRGTAALGKSLARIWVGCRLPLHVGLPAAAAQDLLEAVAGLQVALSEAGCQTVLEPGITQPLAVNHVGDWQNASLLAVALPRQLKKDHPLLPWLCELKVPLLLQLF